MPDQDHEPTGVELAAIETELPEWDLLAVQDYWAAVVDEELEAAQPPATSYRWNPQGPGERQREHRAHRRGSRSVLRLVADSVELSEFTSEDSASGGVAA